MCKNITTIIILISISFNLSFAQQLHLNSLSILDKYYINPAAAGSRSSINAYLTYRKQFIGLEGAPTTQFLQLHAPLQSQYMGLGLKLINDQLGVSQNTTILGTYVYQIGFGKGKLALGLEGGVLMNSIDFSNLVVGDDEYDASIAEGKESITIPDASFGIFYFSSNFFAGYSMYHLLKGVINTRNSEVEDVASLYRHHYFTAGYNIVLSDKISVEPSSIVRLVNAAPIQTEIILLGKYNDMLSIGGLYRTGDGVTALLEIRIIKQLFFAYGYDITTSSLSSYVNGSHEVMLRFSKELMPPAGEKEVHPVFYLK